MKITGYVKSWFERGDDDLKAAGILLKEGGSPNSVCFHCQQTAEKYFKGFLAHREKHVRKIHDLDVLLKVCVELAPALEVLKEDVMFLSQFYTESRYPDDFIIFSYADAEKALESARRIKDFILEQMADG